MAGSYVSQLVSGKLSPQEFAAKSADWIKRTPFISSHAGWVIDAAERLLVARGCPAFLAEIITNEIKEALGINPAPPPPAPS